MPRPASQSWSQYLGPGAVVSLLLACASAVLGLGLPVGWRLRQVLRAAGRDERAPADAILVLGRSLQNDRPSAVFRARLDHSFDLWRSGLAGYLVVAGGLTGTAARTEAAVGREYLVARGVPSHRVLTEDRSRHTLENLFNVRKQLRRRGWRRLLVVSDPLHLARVAALAHGLSLKIAASPAAAAPPRRGGLRWWTRAAREAILLHWYHVGVWYSRAIGSRRLLRRVT
jgi:uncharacterized SAM-binding protein YcdF (DUF218 family)